MFMCSLSLWHINCTTGWKKTSWREWVQLDMTMINPKWPLYDHSQKSEDNLNEKRLIIISYSNSSISHPSRANHRARRTSRVAIFRRWWKSTSRWLRQNLRTRPHTVAGYRGLSMPWNTRAMARPVSLCSSLYCLMKLRMSTRIACSLLHASSSS